MQTLKCHNTRYNALPVSKRRYHLKAAYTADVPVTVTIFNAKWPLGSQVAFMLHTETGYVKHWQYSPLLHGAVTGKQDRQWHRTALQDLNRL
jgi:hypothetical protein